MNSQLELVNNTLEKNLKLLTDTVSTFAGHITQLNSKIDQLSATSSPNSSSSQP